jgi:hypothetical protein
MKTLLRIVACGLLLAVAVSRATATDVPLNGPAAESFGPGTLDVVVGGVGLGVQPATFSVDVPVDTTVVAAYLYINGRGAGDADVVVNGVPMAAPLVAESSELPFGDCSHIETRRIDLVDAFALVPGTNTLTVDGYTACQPGGAFVVAVVNDPNAPAAHRRHPRGRRLRPQRLRSAVRPDTEVGAFEFAAVIGVRTGRFFVFTHDTQPDRADALWTLAHVVVDADPASLVGGSGGATLFELDRLGVPTSAGGLQRRRAARHRARDRLGPDRRGLLRVPGRIARRRERGRHRPQRRRAGAADRGGRRRRATAAGRVRAAAARTAATARSKARRPATTATASAATAAPRPASSRRSRGRSTSSCACGSTAASASGTTRSSRASRRTPSVRRRYT